MTVRTLRRTLCFGSVNGLVPFTFVTLCTAAVAAAAAHVEHMVRDLKAASGQQRVNLAVDQLLQLRARVEVGDDAAPGAHQVMGCPRTH